MAVASELSINTGASATQMANAIFGDGVTVLGASFTGDNRASGIYSGGDATAPGVTPGDTGVILSTGLAGSITNSAGDPNVRTNTSTNNRGRNGDDDFDDAVGARTFDASWLDVDFVPDHGQMTMQFVFASEEYPEFQNSLYQDALVVWINGVPVDISVGDGDIDPNNLNATSNANLFVDNTNDDYNTEMDGFTVTLTLTMNVNVGQTNSIRIGIADVVDSNYDSNLLIAGDSVQTTLVAGDDAGSIYPNGTVTIDALANDQNFTGGTLTITQINGVDVVAGSTVTLATGQVVTVNADGTFDVTGDGDVETVNFTYQVTSSTGDADTGIVTVSAVPCFVAGSLIDTAEGARPVQTLQPGDLVHTRDHGLQPLRWTGRRVVRAEGAFAPIRIAAGAFGAHGPLCVSPQHRILVQNEAADLMFGSAEVLVAAKHLVDGIAVTEEPGGLVEYVHLLFDRHEIVRANGLMSESFLPGDEITNIFQADTVAEICTLFPDLDPVTGAGYGHAARPILRGFEARMLAADAA